MLESCCAHLLLSLLCFRWVFPWHVARHGIRVLERSSTGVCCGISRKRVSLSCLGSYMFAVHQRADRVDSENNGGTFSWQYPVLPHQSSSQTGGLCKWKYQVKFYNSQFWCNESIKIYLLAKCPCEWGTFSCQYSVLLTPRIINLVAEIIMCRIRGKILPYIEISLRQDLICAPCCGQTCSLCDSCNDFFIILFQTSFSIEHFAQLLVTLRYDETFKIGTRLWDELRTWLQTATETWPNFCLVDHVQSAVSNTISGKSTGEALFASFCTYYHKLGWLLKSLRKFHNESEPKLKLLL